MKKTVCLLLAGLMTIGALTGCGSSADNKKDDSAKTETTSEKKSDGFDTSSDITVVSREDGSGTRGAFIELFGVQKEENGEKMDMTTEEAVIANSTAVMMTTVAGDDYAIGYASLGSLDDTTKALKVDGVEPSVDTIKDGSYKISRPFNIATKDNVSDVAQDFINYIMSDDGQKVIEDNGYISQGSNGAFTSDGSTGKIVVAGSSSVTPVMQKLIEAYKAINKDAEIEVQESDSTTGMTAAMEGTCDIGMASRELKDSESELKATAIAMDGIAVIVNKNNTLDDITSDQVKDIYLGDVTSWDEL